MNLPKLLLALKSIGIGPAARTARYAATRDRLNARYAPAAHTTSALLSASPGALHSVQPIPGGRIFRFERAALTVEFLAPDLARLSWDNAPLPVPYALAKTQWVEVAFEEQTHPSGGRMDFIRVLISRDLQIQVQPEGGIVFLDPAGAVLRREAPPEFSGAASTHRAALAAGERIYGLGERAAPLDRRGRSYRLWNTDPGGAYGPGRDPIYVCIPLYLGRHTQGSYLVFYENSFPGSITLEEQATASFEGGALRYYFIPGPLPRALSRYTELTGRAGLPPRWSLGYHQCRWGYKTEAEIRQVIAGFKEHDLPISAIHLDIDYMDGYRVFTVDKTRFPDLKKLTADLEVEGVKTVTIIDPAVKKDPAYDVYRAGVEAKAYVTEPGGKGSGKPLIGIVWPGWAAFPDFTSPRARQWWGQYYPRLLDAGVAGIWHDMNEPTSFAAWGDPTLPLAARHDFDGRGGEQREAHNLYGLLMSRAGHEALRQQRPERRPWLLTRSAWAGIQRYSWSWTGDTETSWPSLRMTIPEILGLGLCGQPYNGPDIGGFSGGPSPELYARWFQLAAFLPFFRTHAAVGTPMREPWVFGDEVTAIVRRFLRLRYQMMPYWYTLAWQAAQTGWPIVRPLLWADADTDHPAEDDRLWSVDDSFLLGDALLVAPILEENGRGRKAILPRGEWYDFWEGARHTGPAEITVEAPLERLPLFVRAGSILPLADGDRLALHAYAASDSSPSTGELYSDAGDGYGPSRRDTFRVLWDGGAPRLEQNSEGEYPFPYAGIDVHPHRR